MHLTVLAENGDLCTASSKLQFALAGVNAARRAQDLATVVIPRDSSYLGTLVDDLVTKVPLQHSIVGLIYGLQCPAVLMAVLQHT